MAVIKGYIESVSNYRFLYSVFRSACDDILIDLGSDAVFDGGLGGGRVGDSFRVDYIHFDKKDLKAFTSALVKELKQWREFKRYELKIDLGYRNNGILIALIRDDYEANMREAGFQPLYTTYKSLGTLC